MSLDHDGCTARQVYENNSEHINLVDTFKEGKQGLVDEIK
ncbi:Uncharacterised protein [Legionella gratiana]|uniref:Uncharacterized protein n=1 Tax=Legionella gratiana TaxID=45066 RepID=A0A378J9I4_9GAMM|nr:Uncharacterised protein [Legionella gratiana]